MKIVNIIGGLGNQMFQYAFALRLKDQFKDEKVYIDTTHFNYLFFKKIGTANLHNGYEVENVFPNAKLPHAKPWHLMKVSWYIPNFWISRAARKFLPKRSSEYIQKRVDSFAYNPAVLNHKKDMYYEGIWEAIQYLNPIREQIQHVFAHPTPNEKNRFYISQMEKENSVGIHVRRGDYLIHPDFSNICDLEYYKDAISEILKDGEPHTFYIFSNDMKWCKENLAPLAPGHDLVYVSDNTGKDSCWDMFLMSHCKELIIANSSFSWWGAFLNNRGGRVIAPNKWTNRDAQYDIWLDEWIRM